MVAVSPLTLTSQKAPSARRCIKTRTSPEVVTARGFRQKAPSAKRCIKTLLTHDGLVLALIVRKHRAPKGALRRVLLLVQVVGVLVSESTERQKVH